jgi:hypothetical protein
VESDLTRWIQTGCPSFPPPTAEELAMIRQQEPCIEKIGGTDA